MRFYLWCTRGGSSAVRNLVPLTCPRFPPFPLSPLLPSCSLGEFVPCTIRSIHVHYTPVESALAGISAAFAVRPKAKLHADKRKAFARKGMALVDPSLSPASYWEFKAEVLVLHHQTTLAIGYAPIIHVGCVVQAARLIAIHSVGGENQLEALRTGDRAVITCRFMYRPEYLHVGDMLLFREGRAKGVGKLVHLGAPHAGAVFEG
jgi:GTPase